MEVVVVDVYVMSSISLHEVLGVNKEMYSLLLRIYNDYRNVRLIYPDKVIYFTVKDTSFTVVPSLGKVYSVNTLTTSFGVADRVNERIRYLYPKEFDDELSKLREHLSQGQL